MRPRHGGGYDVTVTINGAVPLSFELDTGASDMSIPEAVIDRMLQNGTLSVASFEGIRHYKMANGAVEISRTYRLASVTIGGRTVTDVLCSTGIDKNTFLLGQSFLRKFKSWSINNEDNLLILD